jgi:hypothetical protein
MSKETGAERLVRKGICPRCFEDFVTGASGEPECPECGLEGKLDTKDTLNLNKTITLEGYHRLQSQVKLLEIEKERLLDRCTNYANTVGRLTNQGIKYEAKIAELKESIGAVRHSLKIAIEELISIRGNLTTEEGGEIDNG